MDGLKIIVGGRKAHKDFIMNIRKTVLAVIAAMAAAFAQGKNAIAVPEPKGVNLGDGADWIPIVIQGFITTNFQQYSGMTVIDRLNADMVKAEQRLSESADSHTTFRQRRTTETLPRPRAAWRA